jgi:hypothetical protein
MHNSKLCHRRIPGEFLRSWIFVCFYSSSRTRTAIEVRVLRAIRTVNRLPSARYCSAESRIYFVAANSEFRTAVIVVEEESIKQVFVNALKLPTRTLTAAERVKFVTWHGKARNPKAPVSEGDAMKAFLDDQSVHDLSFGSNVADLSGFSSFNEEWSLTVPDDMVGPFQRVGLGTF